MEATKFLSSSTTLISFNHHHRTILPYRKKPFDKSIIKSAYKDSNNNNGREYYKSENVDENMIVLRMRIQEMKMLETRDVPPSDWMEWEKNYYKVYNEDVLEAIGLLQNYLMGIRPSQALGIVAVLALSFVISSGCVIGNAIEIVRMILYGFHLI